MVDRIDTSLHSKINFCTISTKTQLFSLDSEVSFKDLSLYFDLRSALKNFFYKYLGFQGSNLNVYV